MGKSKRKKDNIATLHSPRKSKTIKNVAVR